MAQKGVKTFGWFGFVTILALSVSVRYIRNLKQRRMPWLILLSYAVLTSSILSVLVACLLWRKKQPTAYTNRLLSLLLLAYGYSGFVSSLVINGGILQVPHFFRTAAPVHYLTGPLLYLYVRASLFSESQFKPWYAWLFVPTIVNTIELIPFYGQSTAYKIQLLKTLPLTGNSLTQVAEGWLPGWFHPIAYTVSGVGYALLAGQMLLTYLRNNGYSRFANPTYARWITTFVLIYLGANLCWGFIMAFLRETPWANPGINIVLTITQLSVSLYIIQRPMLLYGAYRFEPEPVTPPSHELLTPTAEPIRSLRNRDNPDTEETQTGEEQPNPTTNRAGWEGDLRQKLRAVEQYMDSRKPYLQPRLSLTDVSVAVNMPPYLLSSMLNRMLDVEFRDYVNEYRVRYVCQLMQGNEFNYLTLEGISGLAGFSSKTTFYRAFQKHTGLTPAQYQQRHILPLKGGTSASVA